MKKFILSLGVIVLFFACSKDDTPTPISSNSNSENNYSTLRGGIQATRYIILTVVGDKVVDARCPKGQGTCLDEVVITASAEILYQGLIKAIEDDKQDQFFNNNQYSKVFGVDNVDHIQDGLEKGHLKLKGIEMGGTIFYLFIKPQHEKFNLEKMASKSVLTIPVNRN